MGADSRKLSNVGIKGRIKQVLILAGAILLGVIISSAVNGQDFHKAKRRHFKVKYKTQINRAERECYLLSKKRNVRHHAPAFAWLHIHHKPKFETQAEVETPGTRRDAAIVASSK